MRTMLPKECLISQRLFLGVSELCNNLLDIQEKVSVESSSFGTDFTAINMYFEYLRGLRYRLRMMGIPCGGPHLTTVIISQLFVTL